MYTQLMIDLLVVLGGLGLYFFVAYYLKRVSLKKGNQLKIADYISLGTKEKVMLIHVNRQQFLIGVTPTQINLLAELPVTQEVTFKATLADTHQNQVVTS